MIKIDISGLAAREIADLVAVVGGDRVEARVVSDITGAREVAEGKADYYLGACATGAGGALAMAIAILGYSNCFTVSTAGRLPRSGEVQKAVAGGKKAFGFTSDHVTTAVPMIIKAILSERPEREGDSDAAS